jgi:hypothetical protein
MVLWVCYGLQARKKARREAVAAGEAQPTHRAQLGGFGGLMLTKRVGRIKPRGQVLKTIAQIYSEKIVTDQVRVQITANQHKSTQINTNQHN